MRDVINLIYFGELRWFCFNKVKYVNPKNYAEHCSHLTGKTGKTYLRLSSL